MKFTGNSIRSLLLATALGIGAMTAGTMAAHGAAPLEVGVMDFPPYYVLEHQTKVIGGYYSKYLNTLLTRAGLDYAIKGYPPKRLYMSLSEGVTKISMGTTGVADYAGKVLVSPKPVAEINLEIFGMGAADSLPKSIAELKGKSLLTIRGYNYAGLIQELIDPKNNIKIKEANTHEAAFRRLIDGSADFLLDYREPADETLALLHFPAVKRHSLSKVPVHVMVSKTLPDAQSVMDKIMKAYEELNAENVPAPKVSPPAR